MRILLGTFLISLSLAAGAETWDQVGPPDKDGVTLYTHAIDGKSYKAYKGTVVVDAAVKTVLALILVRDTATKWFYNLRAVDTLKDNNPDQGYAYWWIKGVWPTKDRDLVGHSSVEQVASTQEVVVAVHGADPALVPSYPDRVRLTNTETVFKIKSIGSNRTSVEISGIGDPGGSVPAVIANSFVLDMPLHTLQNIKHLAESGSVDLSGLDRDKFAIINMKKLQLPN